MRWIVDLANPPKAEESESSPGVLLCSGYIAGGSLVGVLAAFLNFNDDWMKALDMRPMIERAFSGLSGGDRDMIEKSLTMGAFGLMLVLLLAVGIAGRFRKTPAAPVAKGVR